MANEDNVRPSTGPDDLDSEMADASGASAAPTITSFTPPTEKSPDTMVRMWVSYALLALLTLVVIAGFCALFGVNLGTKPPTIEDDKADAERLMSLMNVVFGPIVTLFSSVVGFYFGARTAKEGTGS